MYDLNLTVPNFNSPKYTDENKFKLLKDYLYQLNETLSFALSERSQSVITYLQQRIEEGEEIDKDEILALRQQSKERFEELKAKILSTAEEIYTNYSTDIQKTETEILSKAEADFVAKTENEEYKNQVATQFRETAEQISINASNTETITSELDNFKKATNSQFTVQSDEIISQVESLFSAKTELGDLEERIESKIIQEASGVTESFTEVISAVKDDLSSVGGSVEELVSELDVYIRRGELETGVYGIEIGRSDSNIKARFTNDRLSFYQGSSEVAYISGSNLYITKAQVLDYLKLGNYLHGYFIFDITERGLEVKWTNGN